MKRSGLVIFLSVTLIASALGIIVAHMLPPRLATEFNVPDFGKLPVQEGGRVKPMDTVARNALMVIQGKQTVRLPEGKGKLDALPWLMDVTMRPEVANTYKVFRIDNDEVLGLFGWKQDEKYFSIDQLRPFFPTILEHVKEINPEPQLRTVFETQIHRLYESLTLYDQFIRLLSTGGHPESLEMEYATWSASIPSGMEAIRAQAEAKPFNIEVLNRFSGLADRYLELSKVINYGVIPPTTPEAKADNDWGNIGQGLLDTIITKEINPVIENYAELMLAYRAGDAERFNEVLSKQKTLLHKDVSQGRIAFEEFFNRFEPFYLSSIIYVMAFISVALSWIYGGIGLRRVAFILVGIALVTHTFGLVARMYIQSRPPVTNLYSSAIFVGWGAVVLGFLLERFHNKGLGTAVAAFVGFCTLVIAHNLGAGGDTLEMMRAVLDSNIWLATHVVIVTLGYAAMFLAGIMGVVFILGALFKMEKESLKALSQMAYGVIAFATLFSFVGTMLGGIWADQSWGRFWGWDPKENGALLIVLWCAIMLHARWGKIVKDLGFMVLAVFGNIVTSWSWFGTNMLGVGLHSYGFMDRAFWALTLFIASQLCVMMLGLFAQRVLKSNQH